MAAFKTFVLAALLAAAAASPVVQLRGVPTRTSAAEPCPTVCIDAVEKCPDGTQIKYGGCYPRCPGDPFPVPPKPTCPTAARKRDGAPEPCPTICVDYVKQCPDGENIEYGGCFEHCPGQPFPTPAVPECPSDR